MQTDSEVYYNEYTTDVHSGNCFFDLPSPDGRRRSPENLGFSYRIADAAAWRDWLRQISGSEDPELEVVLRTLRVKDHAMAAYAANGQAQSQVKTAADAAPVPVLAAAPQPAAAGAPP